MTTHVGILVVGDEVLDGIVLDTNSQWIINQLKSLNLRVKERATVRDVIPEIARVLKRLITNGCDLVFTLGGLGPTHDDKTLRGVAEAFALPLELNDEALKIVTRQYTNFHKRGVIDTAEITEARRKMAVLPIGGKPLDNRVGGAPGVILEVEGTQVVSLPGVPSELMWIFDNQLLDILKKRVEGAFYEEIVYLPHKDESTLAPIIDEVMKDNPGVYIKSMVKPYGESGIRLWISAQGQCQEEVEERVSRIANLMTILCKERLQADRLGREETNK